MEAPTGRDGQTINRKTLEALERRALVLGVPAVVDIYRIYEVEDSDERARIVNAYSLWCSEQSFPTTLDAAAKRIDHLNKILAGVVNKGGKRLPIPVELRPHCPNGHDQAKMTRGWSRPDRPDLWVCYVCRAKVHAGPAALVSCELNVSA